MGYLLALVSLICIGFFLMVSSLFAFHTYLISKNLTTCKHWILLSFSFRGASVLDENFIHESLAEEVWLAFQ